MLFFSGVTPYIAVIDGSCDSITAPTLTYRDGVGVESVLAVPSVLKPE